jgi:hypothetical protein
MVGRLGSLPDFGIRPGAEDDAAYSHGRVIMSRKMGGVFRRGAIPWPSEIGRNDRDVFHIGISAGVFQKAEVPVEDRRYEDDIRSVVNSHMDSPADLIGRPERI